MKKNHNLPILLIVIVIVAVMAQFNRHSGEKPELAAMRQDMLASLQLLWEQPGSQVELVPAGERINVQATVAMPPNLRPRQQRWNYPFLRFVALRHPAVTLQTLEVIDGSTHNSISEVALNGLRADRVAPRFNNDDAEGMSQMTARQIGSSLDQLIGSGQGLVLVDTELGKSSRESMRYGAPEQRLLAKRAYPSPQDRIVRVDVCIVLNREIPPATWETFKSRNLSPFHKLRVVTLPKL